MQSFLRQTMQVSVLFFSSGTVGKSGEKEVCEIVGCVLFGCNTMVADPYSAVSTLRAWPHALV